LPACYGAYEIFFVDDGSTDRSPAVLCELHDCDPSHVRVIQFRRNFGKTAAMTDGFAHARGQEVVTMDADLQDDPAELPKLLAKLDEGYDLVGAWRTNRNDPLSKRLPSKIANFTISRLTGLKLRDLNCGFKVYRREVTRDLRLYGELHRFVPVLAHWKGYRTTEVPVTHHARRFGNSKFGGRRFTRSYIDLISVLFLTRYLKQPMRLFGLLGSAAALVGAVAMLYLFGVWLVEGGIGFRPLLFFGITALVVGIQLISLGLLGEMLRNVTFCADDEYSIRAVWDDYWEEGCQCQNPS